MNNHSNNKKGNIKNRQREFLKIYHQNIQDLNSRLECLEIVIDEINPDIVVVTEHNCKSFEINRLNLNGYKKNAFYAREIFKNGGVLIMSRTNIRFEQVVSPQIDNICQEKQFECCCVKYYMGKYNIILVGVYRAPSSDVNEFLYRLEELCNYIFQRHKYVIIAGDFNINMLDSNSPSCRGLKNILTSFGMHYLVDFPTRVTLSSETAIDNFLTNIPQQYTKISGLITEISDHDGQLLELCHFGRLIKSEKNLKMYTRNFSDENISTFYNLLEKETWLNVYQARVEEKYNVFNNYLKYYFDLSFPIRTTKVSPAKKRWINEDIRVEKKDIVNLQKIARQTKDSNLSVVVSERKKQFKKKIAEAKKNYIDNKINVSDNINKILWKIINEETSNKNSKFFNNINLKMGDKLFTNPKDVVHLFNSHFTDTTYEIKKSYFSHNHVNESPDSGNVNVLSRCKPVDENEIKKLINSLKNKMSSGHDEIPIKVFKFVGKPLLPPLVHLINSSLITGIFPDQLKIAKVVPLFKKGEVTEISNYRPISLLPAISKIFEKTMYNRLVEYFEQYNLFDDSQHGFRKGKSVTTAAVDFVESIIKSIDNHEKVISIFMDLSKAFDKVCHKTLLKKLENYGVKGIVHKWIASYLSNRYQYVETNVVNDSYINKISSSLLKIERGVPQGSILGPLLFLCYINDMPECITNSSKNKLCMYADDSTLKISAKSKNELELESFGELGQIQQFLKDNELLLNVNKTTFMSFVTKQNRNKIEPNIMFESESILQVNNTNFLGLCIDENLSWDLHIEKLQRKINSGIFAIRRMSYFCSIDALKKIYFAYVHSLIAFGISLYGGSTANNLDKILILQKKVIRIMLGLKSDESVKEQFKQLKILTIYGQYIFDTIILTKQDCFKTLTAETHVYNTRYKSEIITNHHKLEFYKKTPTYIGLKFYRKLPQQIKKITNIKSFKNNLKSYLTDKALYSVNEFLEN